MSSKQKNKQKEEEIKNLLLSLMEGYSDSAILPFSDISLPLHQEAAAAAGTPAIENKSSNSPRKRCSRDHGDYKEEMVPIVNKNKRQKERRDQMNDNFMTLQTMLPNLTPKASRDKIIDETVSHIGVLEEEIKRLEEKKNSSSSMVANGKISTYSNENSSVSVTVSGNIVFFGIKTLARHGMVTEIFVVFHKHGAEVLTSNVTVNHGQLTLTVTAFVDGNKDSVVVEKIKRDILVL